MDKNNIGLDKIESIFEITIPYYTDTSALVEARGGIGIRTTLSPHPDANIQPISKARAELLITSYFFSKRERRTSERVEIDSLTTRLFEEDRNYRDRPVNVIYAKGKLYL